MPSLKIESPLGRSRSPSPHPYPVIHVPGPVSLSPQSSASTPVCSEPNSPRKPETVSEDASGHLKVPVPVAQRVNPQKSGPLLNALLDELARAADEGLAGALPVREGNDLVRRGQNGDEARELAGRREAFRQTLIGTTAQPGIVKEIEIALNPACTPRSMPSPRSVPLGDFTKLLPAVGRMPREKLVNVREALDVLLVDYKSSSVLLALSGCVDQCLTRFALELLGPLEGLGRMEPADPGRAGVIREVRDKAEERFPAHSQRRAADAEGMVLAMKSMPKDKLLAIKAGLDASGQHWAFDVIGSLATELIEEMDITKNSG